MDFNETILAQMPGFFCWRDLDSRFVAANLNLVRQLMGFSQISEIVGISDGDMRCSAALCADEFRRQDLYILKNNKSMLTLNIHPYGLELKTLISRKEPYYDKNGNVVGIFSNLMEFNQEEIHTLYAKIIQFDKYYRKKDADAAVVKEVVEKFDFANLSIRESEVLFFLVRGYTAKDIAHVLKVSARTVETHINNVKNKIGLDKKSEIIMYCIENGYLNLIPRSILFLSLNISISL